MNPNEAFNIVGSEALMSYSLKQRLGALLYDFPRFVWSIRPSARRPWVFMRNRNERLTFVSEGRSLPAAQCNWRWTSDLHLAKVFPSLGGLFMERVFRDWPIEFRAEPLLRDEKPDVSFIIGHRGVERLPQLLQTLKSIAAQREVAFECIVVEQSTLQEAKPFLPSWVRYFHTSLQSPETPYSRAWAFNVGAKVARSNALVLHDNDTLAPCYYGREILARLREGFEVINLKRFIFYLNRQDSALIAGDAFSGHYTPDSIMQNALGGSIAVSSDAFRALGGFDESFVGWGGEDNEFWERGETRSCWPFGYLPFVHLWHSNQPGKYDQQRETAKLSERRSLIPAHERIAELSRRDFGNPHGCSYQPGV